MSNPGILKLCVACAFGLTLTLAGEEFAWNEKDLTGWKVPEPNPFWRVENKVLIGENDSSNKGHVLYTEQEFKNFALEADARWSGEIDSGFMFRKPTLQMQIGISRALKVDMTGSFYTGGKDMYPQAGRAKDAAKVVKPGEWNKFRIEARDNTFSVSINGKKVSEYTDLKYAESGPIGLQIHAGLPMKVEFRNIRIKSLD